MNVLKRKDFVRWQAREKLADAALCKAVEEMEGGLIDANRACVSGAVASGPDEGAAGGECWWRCIVPSKLIESLRGDLAALHKAGAISKVTMRQFDAIRPPPVREFSASDIKRLRERLKFSQPVFAHLLHTTASTVRKWEQGDTRPAGPALKLLNMIADKGLEAVL